MNVQKDQYLNNFSLANSLNYACYAYQVLQSLKPHNVHSLSPEANSLIIKIVLPVCQHQQIALNFLQLIYVVVSFLQQLMHNRKDVECHTPALYQHFASTCHQLTMENHK